LYDSNPLGAPLLKPEPLVLPVRWLLLIFSAVLVVRMASMCLIRSWEFPDQRSFGFEMGQLGASLAAGKGFVSTWDGKSPSALFPPLYPLVVASSFLIFGTYTKAAAVAVFLFQSTCSAIAGVLLAVLGSRLFNRRAGIIAGLGWALYPSSIFFSVNRIWYSEFVVMLTVGTMAIALVARDDPAIRWIILLGAVSGMIILTDSSMLLYLPLLVIWTLVSEKLTVSKGVLLGVLWALIASVVVSPWLVRNWIVLGTPSLLKSNFGNELFAGNNPFSSGTNDATENAMAFKALDNELRQVEGQSELAYNRYLQRKALEWIHANPTSFLRLTVRRLGYFWLRSPRRGSLPSIHFLAYAPFLIAVIVGCRHLLPHWRSLTPVWLFLLVYPVPYYFTHVSVYRYRYPVEAAVLLLSVLPVSLWTGPLADRLCCGWLAKSAWSSRVPRLERSGFGRPNE